MPHRLSLPTLLIALAGLAPFVRADITPNAGMMRWPDVSKDSICFVYANDIYIAPKAGGKASPLASPQGLESFPRFSADGSTIAFVGNYDGDRDLYTINAQGGTATRVTHHPSDETLCDWTPDGKLLFLANNMAVHLPRTSQMWTVSPEGGLPLQVSVPYAGFGSISPDGQWLAYTTHSTDTRTWKRYRGGMATDVWLFNLKTKESKRITDWEGTDTIPMWVPGGKGDKVYFLSDRGPEHRLNVWQYDIASNTTTQVTTFTDDDVRWPGIGPGDNGEGEIVFQLGSKMMLLNLGTSQSKQVIITIPGDRPHVRTRTVGALETGLQGASISPTGKRVVVNARGDLFTAPAKEGATRALTRTDSIFERDPAWSPDGSMIAYFSDESGEYELWVRGSDAIAAKKGKDAAKNGEKDAAADQKVDQKNDDNPPTAAATSAATKPIEPRKLTSLGEGFRFTPQWSPDSKHIVISDQAGVIRLVSVETGEVKVIDTDPWANRAPVSWSHDSAWIAYVRSDDRVEQSGIWLYEVATGTRTQVISDFFNSYAPTFDRTGDMLYFISMRDIERPIYADNDTSFAYAMTQRIYAVPLRADVKNPLAVKADEEELKKPDDKKKDDKPEDKKDEKPGDDKKPEDAKAEGKEVDAKADSPKDSKKDAKPPLKIDLANFERRAMQLPIDEGSFAGLAVTDKNRLLFIRNPAPRSEAKRAIKIFDIAADERKEELVVDDVTGMALSADGKKILVYKPGNRLQVADAAAGGGKPTSVPTSDMRVTIDPRDEWRQIIRDTYRVQRDWFYEPTLHGVDWDKIHDHYAAMVDDATTREDIAWIQAEMISELNIGHAYVSSPGDVEEAKSVGVGMLGADFELAGGEAGPGVPTYRIARIIEGNAWDIDARGPLSQPGIDVKVGDYLLAVNGTPVDTKKDPWAAFVGLADRVVTLTVSDKPAGGDGNAQPGSNTRNITIKTLSSESDLRFRAWIEGRRAYVEKQTGGAVGYIYVPNTGVDGQNELFRQFFGQRGTQALIIDERWNGGGQIPTRFIELLNRPVTNYWAVRHGNDWTWPPDSHQGPKAMLVNGLAGSGGDMFPWLFKHNNLGPVVGTRTWGGLVGISGNPALIDGGYVSVPTFGFYETDGTWGVEGHGTDPTHEVLDDPAKMQNGGDPQLDKAIELMQAAIKEKPYVKPARPQSPNRRGMGLPPADR
jgi:tricorn protease